MYASLDGIEILQKSGESMSFASLVVFNIKGSYESAGFQIM